MECLMPGHYDGPNQRGFYPVRKIRVFFHGLRLAALYNVAASYKIVVSCIALTLSFFFREWVDMLLIFLATAQILTAELLNSAIEELCDYVQPAEDARIGAVKDMAAAAAGISMLIWCIVVIYQFSAIVLFLTGLGSEPAP